jgi:AcrR family transcriptional regulator
MMKSIKMRLRMDDFIVNFLNCPIDKWKNLCIITDVMTDQSVRKKQIMEKAKALFAERGYYPVTVEEVADACGVAKGTLYLYFDSKVDLFVEIFVGAHRKIIERVRKIVVSGKNFKQIVSGVFDYFEKFIRGDRFFMRFGKFQKNVEGSNVPFECFQKINESVMEVIESFEEEAVKVIRGYLVGSDLNPYDIYEIIVSLILAIEESESETIKNTALSVFLDGVRKEVK